MKEFLYSTTMSLQQTGMWRDTLAFLSDTSKSMPSEVLLQATGAIKKLSGQAIDGLQYGIEQAVERTPGLIDKAQSVAGQAIGGIQYGAGKTAEGIQYGAEKVVEAAIAHPEVAKGIAVTAATVTAGLLAYQGYVQYGKAQTNAQVVHAKGAEAELKQDFTKLITSLFDSQSSKSTATQKEKHILELDKLCSSAVQEYIQSSDHAAYDKNIVAITHKIDSIVQHRPKAEQDRIREEAKELFSSVAKCAEARGLLKDKNTSIDISKPMQLTSIKAKEIRER